MVQNKRWDKNYIESLSTCGVENALQPTQRASAAQSLSQFQRQSTVSMQITVESWTQVQVRKPTIFFVTTRCTRIWIQGRNEGGGQCHGRRKSQQGRKYFIQCSAFASETTQVQTRGGAPNLFLTPLRPWSKCGSTALDSYLIYIRGHDGKYAINCGWRRMQGRATIQVLRMSEERSGDNGCVSQRFAKQFLSRSNRNARRYHFLKRSSMTS